MENKHSLGAMRQSYELADLSDAAKTMAPLDLFSEWFSQADTHSEIEEANAMSLVTLGTDGYPKARVVLLKHFDREGFVFYTNYKSDKGQAIAADSKVGISFFWPALQRQIIIQGQAEKLPAAASDAYFDSRPLGSRMGAWVSPQSQVIANREVLETRLQEIEKKYAHSAPKRPDHWGGYVVKPFSIEFWQGRPNRLHDRLLFTQSDDLQWSAQRLAP